ncbi:tubulin-like doman-containing protein [Streptomyces sp. Li-HN-5-11]|uniref:tubulin-like doman-containing protein n=1 Tax=Streptomyces sp. Li-HN-5-11 TaxID=3075432 RepID=UPI0028AE8735|nr:tubulin-like doman-containing protein [Streptomyces sp. Li-HN-5-11]WNM31552.1 tubulin-like doman-containing protein [Streptomyces sp. Li-HN-5-11]
MKIYQPMLFVGLGGTGCLIGAELENRLREALCGPDGTALFPVLRGRQLLPYQLPDCLQFVYADLNEAELNRLPHMRAEGPLKAAHSRTSRATFGLLPRFDSYPEVARSLRTNLPGPLCTWLPPRAGEPRIAPLIRGAGQLPTVGRAALFETFRSGLGAALGPLREAISLISKSGGDLTSLGGTLADSCDVFVAFSVAGGTGSGIFYDYLHLIGQAFEEAHYRVKIYPLVLMPSAFDDGRGGGRAARLNAGRSLVDLFRLVDDQNAPDVDDGLDDVGTQGQLRLEYPGGLSVRLRPSTTQTAFLFSRTSGIEREDLHRSVVSLVMSLLGTELGDDDGRTHDSDHLYQSFADSFINTNVERAAVAPTGIGHRGVSTSLVASMTVPVDELAELLASRLQASALRQQDAAPRPPEGSRRELVREFFTASNIDPLWSRASLPVVEPRPVSGARAILDALAARQAAMEDALGDLDRQLRQQVAELAGDFDPVRGVRQLLGRCDVTEAHRVVLGDPGAKDRLERVGFAGLLENRRREPERPPGLTTGPPQFQGIRDRMGGLVKAKWTDPEVTAALQQQDTWYQWESRRTWHRHWADQAARWDRTLAGVKNELTALVGAFREQADEEHASFSQRTRHLYRPRTGVSYLLPPQADLTSFYDAVVRRLLLAEGLRETDDERALLNHLLSPDQWRAAFGEGRSDPRRAVHVIKEQLQHRIKRLFVEPGNREERPLLPRLGTLLAEAAAGGGGQVADDALEQCRHKLASLLPVGFSPEGSGRLKVLIVYPATSSDSTVRRFLEREMRLPRDSEREIEFRPVSTESVTVVLFRSAMSLTEVPEVRETLTLWAEALASERPGDHLRWRQRLGYDYDFLMGTEQDRRHILHRLLCAMWNNQFQVFGDVTSPRRIRIGLQDRDSAAMVCSLDAPGGGLSSWGNLLRAYEAWTLAEDSGGIRNAFCEQLMTTIPLGLEMSPIPPHGLFRTLVHEVAPQQSALLEQLAQQADGQRPAGYGDLTAFWNETLPAALDLPFPRAHRMSGWTLRKLDQSFQPAPGHYSPPVPDRRFGAGADLHKDPRGE